MLLKVSGLTKYYNGKLGVENINLYVSEGEIVGFVGPNGAGKTTTIRTVMGFLKPDAGIIEILGQQADRKSFKDILKSVGYVPGEVNYYDNETVEKIIEFYKGFYNDFDDHYCEELCRKFDLPLKKRFEELSSGNKKKLAIIQALAHKPKLVIMDEPTNGLDPFVQKVLYKTLNELRENGVGIFLSSHVLSEVQKLCNRVIFIKQGHIIEPRTFEHDLKKIVVILKESSNSNLREATNEFSEIVELKDENGKVVLFMKWNAEKFKKLIASIDFEDITIEDLSLEDVFDELYKPVDSAKRNTNEEM
ncbi:ABC transporter ATP-binding protein [Fervidobacterium pennivorans subsp. shakshaketiis]|jgi:ABC-2 type transport system ATP-binding protein|uniref:ABC transporter ATP-binding protein n=1 Tax=Fervidobacterium pennivorans TaxID=93466 RepID=UPI00355B46D1